MMENTDHPILDESQIEFALAKIREWVSIKIETTGVEPTPECVEHSILLRRLLSGIPASKYPPPKINSQPCHALLLGLRTYVGDIVEVNHAVGTALLPTRVMIGDSLEWQWEDKENLLLRHMFSGDIYKYENGYLQIVKKGNK